VNIVCVTIYYGDISTIHEEKIINKGRDTMKRRDLINKAFSIMIQNPSLWIVTLFSLAIYTIGTLILFKQGIAGSIISMLLSFAIYAFLPAALIKMVDSIAERQAITTMDGVDAGIRHFLPLLALRFILLLPIWIILIVYTGSVVSIFSDYGQPGGIQGTQSISNLPMMFGVIGVIMLLSLISSAISVGADRAIVLEGIGVIIAIKRGIGLLLDRLGDYFVIGILMLIISIAFSFLISCCTISTTMLLYLGDSDLSSLLESMQTIETDPFSNMPFLIISTTMALVLQSATRILFSGTWTLAFRHWQGKKIIVPEDQPALTIEE
jgi:hypothetical protein